MKDDETSLGGNEDLIKTGNLYLVVSRSLSWPRVLVVFRSYSSQILG